MILECNKVKTMPVFLTAILMSLIVATSVTFSGCSNTNEQKPGTTVITDMAGRKVSVEIPVSKIVLVSSRHLHEFAAVGGAEVMHKIVGWGSDLNLYDQDTYLKYEASFPEIASIPDIGYHYTGTFSVEAVVNLQPDVAVFPLWLAGTEGVSEDIRKLETAGIPSVFIDYYVDPFNHPVLSTAIIGKLLGRESRAGEIIEFYQEQVAIVADRLAEYNGTKATAYVEAGSRGASEYGNTYSSESGLGALVKFAGGVSIADGVIIGSGVISPEYLLVADPDVIIIGGSYWPSVNSAMRLGYHAIEAESRELLRTFTQRGGWNYLSAVQNDRVCSVFHGFSFRIYNFAGIQAFAKFLYPDLFADIDPAANFKQFHDMFMPAEFSGVWIIELGS